MFPYSRNRINRNPSPLQGRPQIQQQQRFHQEQDRRQAQVPYRGQPQNKQNQGNSDNLIAGASITNQFALLKSQSDNFARETEDAEKELQQVQASHQTTKNHHNDLFEAIRQAKQELGCRKEKLTMLKEEEARLRRLVDNEFKAIQGCTKHSNLLEKKKVEVTKKHTTEINPLNFELAALLEHRMHKKTERHISHRSVQAVVVPALTKALKEKNKPQLSKKKKQLSKSIKHLKKASKQHQQCIARLGQLKAEENRHFRAKSADRAHQDENNARGDHVDLFYGRSDGDEHK